MSLGGCQINPIDVNFYLQKVWKSLMQIQLTKSNHKITRGVKVPCLIPIRVKQQNCDIKPFALSIFKKSKSSLVIFRPGYFPIINETALQNMVRYNLHTKSAKGNLTRCF